MLFKGVTLHLPCFVEPGDRGSTPQCYSVMYAIARAFQVTRIVEIGTHIGASAITFCKAMRDNKCHGKIWTIDSKQDPSIEDRLIKAGISDRVTVIHARSENALPGLFEKIGKVSLCFIDGDHDPKAMERDFWNCAPHTRLILLHDTGKNGEKAPFLKDIDWAVIHFPTRIRKGDKTGPFVGISLAVPPQEEKVT